MPDPLPHPSHLALDIAKDDPFWKAYNAPFFKKILEAFPVMEGFPDTLDSLSILLTDDATIQAINHTHREKDSPTNVLSFPQAAFHEGRLTAPLSPGTTILGDIVMAHETITREAHAENKSFDQHLTHLFIHGMLHLMGYDHMTDADAEKMESLEINILKQLNIPNPYQ